MQRPALSQVEGSRVRITRIILLLLLLAMAVPALAKPFLRVDIRNGEKVPPHFHISGKTSRGCVVVVDVRSWDGFGAEFEVLPDHRGYFTLPVSIEGRTVTTHVDIVVRSFDPRQGSDREIKRYVILDRNCKN